MLSPFTQAGTKVICVQAQRDILPVLREGGTYTVHGIMPTEDTGYGVWLVETLSQHQRWRVLWRIVKTGDFRRKRVSYSLHDFELLALPECLTELLNVAPVKQDA
jgi:hypothetical protein